MTSHEKFLELLETLRPRLHRYTSKLCGSVVDGEDVLQETLASAFLQIERLTDPTKLESWIFSIAHNQAVDFLRKKKNIFSIPEDYDIGQSFPDELELKEEVKAAVRSLVGLLPPQERACILLKDWLDFSLTEIAEITGSTEGSVKSALHREERSYWR